ncbi:MAG: putative DNA binding domain-containing protein [Ignavibacteria bacterium]|nr:putative DNA binding domain-containing protein [Ignavibacteria bacterium]
MNPVKVIQELIKLPKESEWVEFKRNNSNPDEIGEYISAISNSAALWNKTTGFICWGIEDSSHEITGTTFSPSDVKIGNEELENWLLHHLNPRTHFSIYKEFINAKPVVLIQVAAATQAPVKFKNEAFIRIGSYKKKLKDHLEKERLLWDILSKKRYEEEVALPDLDEDSVIKLLNYPSFFELLGQPLPDNKKGILERLSKESFIRKNLNGNYDILNLGAILFAKDFNQFPRLSRKSVRVIVYKSTSRIETEREFINSKGYATCFGEVVDLVNSHLPQNELIGTAFRRNIKMYPEIAIRELIANALIHQDFFIAGAGPMIEIFTDRIEITNPGNPLIDTLRFIDEPPRSRNDTIAAFMRRINICEERGSGIDKVIFSIEAFQLPAPDFQAIGDNTKSILYSPKIFKVMSREERIRACYQHCCLRYVSNMEMTNNSLRIRFNIAEENYSMVSRVISESIKTGFIRQKDSDSKSRRFAKYVPYWA